MRRSRPGDGLEYAGVFKARPKGGVTVHARPCGEAAWRRGWDVAGAGMVLALVLSAAPSTAVEVSVKPQVRTAVEFNDNRRLTTRPHDSVVGAIVDARASIFLRTPVEELTITPRVRSAGYRGEDGLDTTDGFIDASYRRRTERSEYRLIGNFTKDTALSNDLAETVRVPSNTRRTSFELSPQFDHRFDARTTGSASFTYTDVAFDKGLRAGLADYRYPVFALGLSHSLTERDDASVSAYVARFEAPQFDSQSDTAGVTLALEHRFSDTLDGHAGVGVSVSRLKPSPATDRPDTTKRSLLFSFSLRKRLERTQFEANLSRAVSPTADGQLVQRDELNVSVRHRFFEKLTGDAELGYLENSGLSRTSSRSDWKARRLELALRYRLSEIWRLDGVYRYRYRSNSVSRTPGVAQSNAFLVNLVYTGQDPLYRP